MANRPGANRRHLALEDVGSTNAVALEAARAGDPGTLWVTAARQTAGRGRRGRAWVSEAGNLYASLLLIDPAPPEDLMNLPLVAALGVHHGLVALKGAGRLRIEIKWPNDILIDGAKCVGILIESERLDDGRVAAVIGCGVNVAHLPPEAGYPVTGLRQAGLAATVADVFDAVAGGIEDALRLWDRGRGFAGIREAWLSHAAGLGGACTVNLHDGALAGRFAGLHTDGRLLLDLDGGERRAISAGDLFLLGPANATRSPATPTAGQRH